MTRILLTAFEPYDRWKDNSSWLALIDFTSWYDGSHDITTRRYPVDLPKLRQQLREDLAANYDFAIHLGQAPGASLIKLEAVGLNMRTNGEPLLVDAPAAYRTSLDLIACQERLLAAGIPTSVSHHAGTYLCNAALYMSLHYSHEMGRRTESLFVHLPLTPAQVVSDGSSHASMSTPMESAAIALIVEQLAEAPSH
ncbi:pyroglutamyl-peptidase I [Roseiconus lacunae]|uniref:Pyrrolidone-carboxylate peptidase n=1 Tax=Roseiconus lacunae TaxID=2605694 RepID=A0ABT7PI43_9BACT|nr:pyroglutamyl-peptidase I [Roseiconus lacunae]MCD0461338.1 pyroglutamyl-peptidase I [Roseiconus lacunae]MDM4016165.1 pyroglutamyl-peptidase I [Roseiconus lacunae]WRQ51501.1 pyroglutamyl-peptidase I [Stieleria sp. HD01]